MIDQVQIKLSRNLEILAREHGQQRSMEARTPVDAAGNPLPWYTYPAQEHLHLLDFSACRVFEYGCGHSSLWWAQRARQVFSVEHNEAWASTVAGRAPANLQVLHVPERQPYVESIARVGGVFDVIVIDGRWRLDCARQATAHLAPTGMAIFDNADWYVEAPATLEDHGLLRVDFSGFGPINNYCWSTSIFLSPRCTIPRRNARLQPVGGLERLADYDD